MTIKVKMLPHPDKFEKHESGIKQVVINYDRYFPQFDIEIVPDDSKTYDLKVVHAGMTGADNDVSHLHGLYWTADYDASAWEFGANANIVEALRHTKQITVPSDWVAETLRRDMRINPHVVGHGIDVDLWKPSKHEGYVLWNKNRNKDVCDPTPMALLAQENSSVEFVTTFMPYGWSQPLNNIRGLGLVAHDVMQKYIQRSMVYLSTTKETFGIGILEAMAAGVPVLGFDWGGNRELIKHGVNGYLAQPNNIQDLSEGLAYCIKHRDTLGANGREMAKEWTWENAVEKVAGVYRLALESDPYENKVSVVIPVYNYAESLERAVKSVLEQTYEALEIIIVNDGSTDETESVGIALSEQHEKVQYFRKENGGVATARNYGIERSRGSLICCLDADDQLKPKFIEACIPAFKDRSLGIAYTGLWFIKPNGEEGLSEWPPDVPDYDKHLSNRSPENARGLNQIPTCCIFRREAWERTGGYKQRYAPLGQGAEDAEFWTRIMSIGYGAKKATPAGLFVYSLDTGRASSAYKKGIDINLVEPMWLSMHPWGKDGKHPFASRATPEKISHPVRQYDQPIVSVVIPVGPGHEENLKNALDSLEAQTFRQWEVIVVWDNKVNRTITSLVEEQSFFSAYPYVREIFTEGEQGAGFARNRGGEIARADFLVFLDADDTLAPTALQEYIDGWENNETIIYSDYYNSIITTKEDIEQNFQPSEIVQFIEKTGKGIVKGKSSDYDCERAQRQPTDTDLFHWCLVTCFVPKAWHDAIGGFDEAMDTFEDVLYHWAMARHGYCYTRIEKPLISYHLHTGKRRERANLQTEQGRAKARNMLQYSKDVLEKIEMAKCSKCPDKKRITAVDMQNKFAELSGEQSQLIDNEMVLAWYVSPKLGNQHVNGASTGIHYGYKSGGRKEKFLVHRDDLRATPHLFEEISADILSPTPQAQPLTAPQPITSQLPQVGSHQSDDSFSPVIGGVPEHIAPIVTEQFQTPPPIAPNIIAGDKNIIDVMPVLPDKNSDIVELKEKVKERLNPSRPLEISGIHDSTVNLVALPGISDAIAASLIAAGHNTKAKILALGVEGLQKINGLGEIKASIIIDALAMDARALETKPE